MAYPLFQKYEIILFNLLRSVAKLTQLVVAHDLGQPLHPAVSHELQPEAGGQERRGAANFQMPNLPKKEANAGFP